MSTNVNVSGGDVHEIMRALQVRTKPYSISVDFKYEGNGFEYERISGFKVKVSGGDALTLKTRAEFLLYIKEVIRAEEKQLKADNKARAIRMKQMKSECCVKKST